MSSKVEEGSAESGMEGAEESGRIMTGEGGGSGISGLRLRPIKTRVGEKASSESPDSTSTSSPVSPNSNFPDETWADEPMTPAGRVFTEMNPIFVCVCIFGFKYPIDRKKFISHLEVTLMKHKRFSSRVVMKDGRPWWTQVKTNVDDHVFEANLTPEQKEAPNCIENYTTDVVLGKPFDALKPLWDIHLCDAKFGDAAACWIIRIHHALGDGTSLVSLLMACTRSVDKPDLLPDAARAQRSHVQQVERPESSFLSKMVLTVWKAFLVFWYSLVEIGRASATLICMKDSTTVIKGSSGIEKTSRIYRFASFAIADMKYVSKVMGVTLNDVFMAMTAHGVRRYLEHRAQKDFATQETEAMNSKEGNTGGKSRGKVVGDAASADDISATKKLDSLRIRAVALINMRPVPGVQELSEMMSGQASQARWGNHMGYLLVPIPMKLYSDPLKLLIDVHAIGDRKKSSLEGPFSYATGDLVMRLFGEKAAAAVVTRATLQTTMSISNVRGPSEQVMFADNPITHIIPSVTGHPHSLTLHLQSYNGEISLVAMSEKTMIPDPEYILQLCIEGLHEMKLAAQERAQSA